MRLSSSLAVAAAVTAVTALTASVGAAQPSPPSDPKPPRGMGASYLDHAIVDVYPVENGLVEILIHDLGRAKAPAPIAIYRADGKAPTRCGVPLEVFLNGSRVARFRVPAKPAIVRVELDPDHEYPDANRTNDVWTAKR
ncbi:hypothetical protein J421_0346 [Gemmatirosa kalamazoonensis]|uniref:Uncharacterized protein n=1 Tax=Gemmatirosa kalamazoonensis TaxID=861299 RepID=W0RES6_9BACT|nr:hypothetical protein [Gemmatirosa kalamazoonensis]AHG87883.1 hypothetical protein J421_0346 [Gemmatirosa kalamazoonensis]